MTIVYWTILISYFGVYIFDLNVFENGDCSIPSSVSSALSLSHGCFRGSQYENCLVLGRGTSYGSSHTWYDKNALAIGSTRGLLRERYDGSGFLIPFEFHATNQSISTSCTDTSASTSVTYNELRSYLDPYIVDYADSGTYVVWCSSVVFERVRVFNHITHSLTHSLTLTLPTTVLKQHNTHTHTDTEKATSG